MPTPPKGQELSAPKGFSRPKLKAKGTLDEVRQALDQVYTNQLILWRSHQDLRNDIRERITIPWVNLASATTELRGGTSKLDCSTCEKQSEANRAVLPSCPVGDALQARLPTTLQESYLATDTDDVSVDHWSFRHSYWDVAAFLGNRTVFEKPEAIANLFLLLVNIVVQACFVVIVSNIAITTLDDATIDGYHKWRTNTGHAFQYMDPLTEQSLAARVCATDPSLHLSDTQSAQIGNIRSYLEEHSPFNGPMMCVLAVLTWTLTVSREFHVLKDMVCACMKLPGGQTVIAKEGSKLQLTSLSTCRFCYILVLAALRAAIAGALLFVGIRYLIVTISIEDILLNAVALEFVLNVDELMFEALAPNKTRRLMVLMRPLSLPAKTQWRGLDNDFMLIMFVVVSVFSVSIPLWLVPEMDNMRKAEDELCAGSLDVSYSLTVVGTVIWGQGSPSPEEDWRRLKETIRYRVIRNIISNNVAEDGFVLAAQAPGGLTGIGWSVEGIAAWDVEQYARETNSDCGDMLQPSNALLYMGLAALRDGLRDERISSCGDVANYCNEYAASVVRLFCPETCNCANPSSALALPFPMSGCPTSCLTSAVYRTILDQSPCSDVPKDVLDASNTWTSFIDNYLQAVENWGQYRDLWQSMGRTIGAHGCDAVFIIRNTTGLDVCNPLSLKSLQFWCPVTCQCSSRGASILNQCSTQC